MAVDKIVGFIAYFFGSLWSFMCTPLIGNLSLGMLFVSFALVSLFVAAFVKKGG